MADESFAKALEIAETCVSVNNNACGELVSQLESPTIFDERFKLLEYHFFIPVFNLLSCDRDSFTFKVSY